MVTRTITIIGFAGIIASLFALEYLARRPGSRIPRAGEWLGYLMKARVGRVLLLLGWWWIGWHYFAR